MQFLVLGYDGNDTEAPGRRQAARPAHVEAAQRMKAAGHMLVGAALLDDGGNMIGSACLMDFPSRAELEAWLAADPYIKGGVWKRVEIKPCKVTV